ncbi:MAG: hypothetical protein JNM40_16505 [Myxococcales bacterium]|nr:hypothetical protein [Myxococcales bacterium]
MWSIPSLRPRHLAALALVASACQPPTKTISVHWSLADGRSCVDAGVVRVVVSLPGATALSGRCSQLPDGNRITVSDAYPEAVLTARAESAGLAALYRAEQTLPAELPDLVDLILFYSGGR